MLTMFGLITHRVWAIAIFAVVMMLLATLIGLGWPGVLFALGSSLAALVAFPAPSDPQDDSTVQPTQTTRADFVDDPAFSRLLEGIREPALVLAGRRVRLANEAAIRLLGSHIIGEDARIAIRHPAAAERLGDGPPITVAESIEVVGIGQRDQRWDMRIIPIDPSDSDDQRLLIHLTDLSARQAVEQARVDFVANASHELRTPLAAILGYVETLADPDAGGDPEVRARFLAIVAKEARRMQDLVDDLISLSRIEADKNRTPDAQIDLVPLVAEAADVARVTLGARGEDVVLDMPSVPVRVSGDRAQLAQVLLNLIDNAAKYGRMGTPITLSVAPPGGTMARLEVRDLGEGIAPEHLHRLTERFYRVDSGRSRSVGGTGLGLAIVKHIMERHRGRLDIASEPGCGTTVSLLLPLAPGAHAAS